MSKFDFNFCYSFDVVFSFSVKKKKKIQAILKRFLIIFNRVSTHRPIFRVTQGYVLHFTYHWEKKKEEQLAAEYNF